MPRAVFLDRDGVINIKVPEGQYVTRWEDFHFVPGVAEALVLLNQAHFLVVVASNQRGVAKGHMTRSALEEIHRRMVAQLAASNARIDAIYFCPHDLDASCACRKPAPGMLLEAAKDHCIDLKNSWMVGDSETDILAGRNAGCKTVLIAGPDMAPAVAPDLRARSLIEAVPSIIRAHAA